MSRSHHTLQTLGALLGILAFTALTAQAQTEPPPRSVPTPHFSGGSALSGPPISSATKAPIFLRVVLAQKVLQTPLSLKMEEATLDDVALRVQQAIVASKVTPKLPVQVRKARLVRLSFAAKDSTVGDVLRSSGTLGGVFLWVFSDHLLLAPTDALTPDEQAAFDAGSAVFSSGIVTRDSLGSTFQGSFIAFVSNEVKGGKTTFNQLSPEAQAMVQLLFTNLKESLVSTTSGGPSNSLILKGLSTFDLASNPTVSDGWGGTSTARGEHTPESQAFKINFGTTGSMGWSSENSPSGSQLHGTQVGVSLPETGSNPKSLPPFVDPSAGKS